MEGQDEIRMEEENKEQEMAEEGIIRPSGNGGAIQDEQEEEMEEEKEGMEGEEDPSNPQESPEDEEEEGQQKEEAEAEQEEQEEPEQEEQEVEKQASHHPPPESEEELSAREVREEQLHQKEEKLPLPKHEEKEPEPIHEENEHPNIHHEQQQPAISKAEPQPQLHPEAPHIQQQPQLQQEGEQPHQQNEPQPQKHPAQIPQQKMVEDQKVMEAEHIQHPKPEQPPSKHIPIDQKTQEYINKLERQLQLTRNEAIFLGQQLAATRQANSALRQDLESSRQSSMDLRKKKLEIELERTKLVKECEKLKKENDIQRKKLLEVEQIGDVFVLKTTIEDLKLLAQTQHKQIEELRAVDEQKKRMEEMEEQVNLFQKYEEEQLQLKQTLEKNQKLAEEMALELNQLRQTVPQLKTQLQTAVQQNESLKAVETTLRQSIANWQQKWSEFESERDSIRKARELQQSIINYESQKNITNQQELINLNILTEKEQKNILLREYLILESKNKELAFDLAEVSAKLRKLEREQMRVNSHYIKKKQYLDLNGKYNKAKKCLEGAFEQLRQFKKIEMKEPSVQEEINELLEGVEARQCQNFIKSTNNLVNNLQQQVNQLQEKSTISDLKLELTHHLTTIETLKKQVTTNDKILHLMNDDIALKNRLIQEKNQIIQTLRKRKEHLEYSKEAEGFFKLENTVKSLKQTVSIYETQNILLVKEISAVTGELHHWKHLYNQIKDNLTEKITIALEDPSSDHKKQKDKAQQESQQSICKECQLRKLSLLNQPQTQEKECQTDNLYEYYYKEIKELLNFLKKTSKQYDNIPNTTKDMVSVINSIKERFVAEFKDKYQKVQNNYKSKLEELRKQKSQNESWRSKTRDQIREEFQDVRELVLNNRLINALRQAKNLIDYLQKEVQKNEEDNQEEMEEEGQVIEEEKQIQ